jgi:hypothetical protein
MLHHNLYSVKRTTHIIIFLYLLLAGINQVSGQLSINTDGSSPHPSAMLEIKSNAMGFLPPRFTNEQINGIVFPTEGLIVYSMDEKCMLIFNGTLWTKTDGKSPTAGLSIGDNFGGGKVFYLFRSGLGGLVSASTDLTGSYPYGCPGDFIIGAQHSGIGSGNINTSAVVAQCTDTAIAAKKCSDLVLNGYDDWYLPSKDELQQLYLERSKIGGFTAVDYWSSTQYDDMLSWERHFSMIAPDLKPKGELKAIRCIRKF